MEESVGVGHNFKSLTPHRSTFRALCVNRLFSWCEDMVMSPSISILMSTGMSPFIDLMIFLLMRDVYYTYTSYTYICRGR